MTTTDDKKQLIAEWTSGIKMQDPTETHPWGKRVADFSGGGIFGVGAREKRFRIAQAAVADNKARDNYLSRQEAQRIEGEHRAQHGIGTEFANVVNHKAQHGPISKTLEDMLDAVKDTYNPTSGRTDMEMPFEVGSHHTWGRNGSWQESTHQADPHEVAMSLAGALAAKHGIFPAQSATGEYYLHHVDTHNGDDNKPGHFRAYYAENGGDGADRGHVFHVDASGTIKHVGEVNYNKRHAFGKSTDKASPFDPFD